MSAAAFLLHPARPLERQFPLTAGLSLVVCLLSMPFLTAATMLLLATGSLANLDWIGYLFHTVVAAPVIATNGGVYFAVIRWRRIDTPEFAYRFGVCFGMPMGIAAWLMLPKVGFDLSLFGSLLFFTIHGGATTIILWFLIFRLFGAHLAENGAKPKKSPDGL